MKTLLTALCLCSMLHSYGQIQLNEMQSSNSATLADEFGDYDDWIEIRNNSANAIDIGGLVLKDQVDTWAIPSGNPETILLPGGYFLLWADDEEFQGAYHTNFKLASGGEFLGLYESDGETVIDSITIPALSSNTSLIRCQAGWSQSNLPTPLDDNNCALSNPAPSALGDLVSINTFGNQRIGIHLATPSKNDYRISIYSLDGKQQFNSEIQLEHTSLDLHPFERGMYIIVVYGSGQLYSKKIIL